MCRCEREVTPIRQRIVRFANGYGASIIQGGIAYADDGETVEVALVRFFGTGTHDFKFVKHGPINRFDPYGIAGWVTEDELAEILAQVEALPPCRALNI